MSSEESLESMTDAQTGFVSDERPADQRWSIDIFANIKQSQLQNGLRHGDYERYRHYCSRRLRRIRVSLHFANNDKKYVSRTVAPLQCTDVRFLSLPLVSAERAWAYAMQIKNEISPTSQRKHFHLLKRLARGVESAALLETLSSKTCDAQTQLQCIAYHAWLSGVLFLEKNEFARALEKFLHAQAVYEQLGSNGGSALQLLCQERCASLADTVRFCKYMMKDGGAGDISTLAMNDELISSKMQALLDEKLKQQARDFDTVDWQGIKVPVSNDKTRISLIRGEELIQQLKKKIEESNQNNNSDSMDTSLNEEEAVNISSLYQNIFAAFDDALRTIRDELNESKLDSHKQSLNQLKDYATFHRISTQVIRNQQFIKFLITKLQLQQEQPEKVKHLKRSKPDEAVVLYEKLTQNYQDIYDILTPYKSAELPLYESRLLSSQAHRIYYLAQSYNRCNKFTEAYVLYRRCDELCSQFNNKKGDPVEKVNVSKLQALTQAQQYMVHANYILDEHSKSSQLNQQVADLSLTSSSSSASAALPLTARLSSFARDNAALHLVDVPPHLQPAPCKPILFDLAWNHITYPDVSDKIVPEKTNNKKGANAAAAASSSSSSNVASNEDFPALSSSSSSKSSSSGTVPKPKVIAPPAESARAARERQQREEEQRKKDEEAQKAKGGWGLGGIGRFFGGGK